ncbi:MAG: serpin family protein [Planctomycetaceae bacterium]|jgi:serpin B|nr:serpin family protein [Planctomycetaceae bacterium]
MTKNMFTMILVLSLFACTVNVFAEDKTSAQTSKTEKETKKTNDDFLFRFHRTVRDGNNGKSIVVSPFGVSSIGEMLTLGAAGETKEILQKVFIPNEGQADGRHTWYHLSDENLENLPLTSLNGIWIQKTFPVKTSYTETLKSLFHLHVTQADFANHAEECTKINAWIAEATDQKVTKLFKTLDAQSRIVLANVLNFQGKWAFPFDKSKTKKTKFYSSQNKTVEVSMMDHTLRLGYNKQDTYQIVTVPFEADRCSLIVILPDKTQTLETVEQLLTEKILASLSKNFVLQMVRCQLPAFEMESEIDLKPVLTLLGAGIAFDPQKADFTNISNKKGLGVEQCLQKVRVQIDESGVEAVSATGTVIQPKSLPVNGQTISFCADRPFLFLIQDNVSGVPLFIGRYTGQ